MSPPANRLGRLLFHLAPIRRRTVLSNLRLAFGARLGEAEIVRLAQAFYAHAARSALECLVVPWLPAGRRRRLVRVENLEAILGAAASGKGVLILTGHLGNWEVAPVLGLESLEEYRGRLHVLRRPIRSRWLERWVIRRFRRSGLEVVPKSGSLDAILARLAAGDAVVFILDQHASRKDGITVDFFGKPASTFKSLALVALASGAPVVPARSFREPDGTHVFRFEAPLPPPAAPTPAAYIRDATRSYNEALERMILEHPEQWFWMHRRWRERGNE